MALEGALADLEEIALGIGQVALLVGDLSGHQENVGIAEDHGLGAVVIAALVGIAGHPIPAVLAEVPALDAHQFGLVVGIPAPVDAGDVAADVVLVIVEPHRRDRTGIAAAGDGGAARIAGAFGTHREGVVPAAAAVGERNHEQGLVAGAGNEVVLVALVLPQGLEVLEGGGAGGNGILQVGQGLGIQDALLEVRIVGEAVRAQVAGAHHAVVRTLGVTGSHQGDAGVQALGEQLVHAVRPGSRGGGAGIRDVRDGLFEVRKQLLEDHVAAFLGLVDGLAGGRIETGRDITPGADEVVVDHRPEREGLAQEVRHVLVRLGVAVFADALDHEVGALDRLVHLGEGAVVQVQLRVVGQLRIARDLVFLVGGLIGVVPLDIAVQADPGEVAAAIVVRLAEGLGDGEDGILREGVVGVNGRRVERGDFESRNFSQETAITATRTAKRIFTIFFMSAAD